jgi:hypothetical protein
MTKAIFVVWLVVIVTARLRMRDRASTLPHPSFVLY